MRNLAFIQDNLISSLSHAERVAKGLGARIMTLPDLIRLRSALSPESNAWNLWYTPLTTVYFGAIKGKLLAIVAHHLGPLSSDERIAEWAESGTNDEGSSRRQYGVGGMPKIRQDEFNALAEGKYGEVAIIDLNAYFNRYRNDSLHGYMLTRDNMKGNRFVEALFGPFSWEFLDAHARVSLEFARHARKMDGAEQKLIEVSFKDCYGFNLFCEKNLDLLKKHPLGMFLTLGRPSYWGNRELGVSTEIRSREDMRTARFVVLMKDYHDIDDVAYDPCAHWQDCLTYNTERVRVFNVLKQHGGKYFIQYPKTGNCKDTGEIMFEVKSAEPVGGWKSFLTPSCGSPFLKYHIDEVKSIAPSGANAYILDGNIAPGEIVKVPVRFYRVEFDPSKRIMKEDEVMKDLPLLLKINGIKA